MVAGSSNAKNNAQDTSIDTGIYSDLFRDKFLVICPAYQVPLFYFSSLIFQASYPFWSCIICFESTTLLLNLVRAKSYGLHLRTLTDASVNKRMTKNYIVK